jgi:Protein of unknown function (DUF3667).
MQNNCPNCNQVVDGNFCSNCGQRALKRIDRKYIWEEIQYTLLHTNKGLLYSVKNVIKNPGKTAREFIDGKRINHYKPILLVFVLTGISAFISFKIVGLNDIMKEVYSKNGLYSDFMSEAFSFVASYSSFIMIFFIPFLALFSKIAFRKWGHNYYEHVIMNSYILSFSALFDIIVYFPILFLVKHTVGVFDTLPFLQFCFIPFIYVWFFKGFYKERSIKSIIPRILLILFMTFIGFIFLVIAITIYLLLFEQELLQQMQ